MGVGLYTYWATPARVVDGDTVDLTVDCGFGIRLAGRFRLAGVNTPELGTGEGRAARDAALGWFAAAQAPVWVQTTKDRQEKYGRYLAWVYGGLLPWPAWEAPRNQAQADILAQAVGHQCLNVALVAGGHAVWYWV